MLDLKNKISHQVFESSNIILLIDSLEENRKFKTNLRTCNVLIIETFQSCMNFYGKLTKTVFNSQGYYVVVLANGKIDESEEIFKLLWKEQIYNAAVVYAGDSGVEALTFHPFNSRECDDTTVMQFDDAAVESGKLFPDKLRDLASCPMRITTSMLHHM